MNPYRLLNNPAAMGVFLFTLALPVLVGFLALKRTRSQADYLIGNRMMNSLVVALSAVSSGRSSWLVLGVSGIAFSKGISAVWAVVGYILVELFQFVTIGRRLRLFCDRCDAQTLLDFYEERYSDERRHLIRRVGAVIILIFMTAYVSAQFNAGAKALSVALEWPGGMALAASVLMVLVYMVLGGYVAVAYNDVVRAFIMIFGLIVFPAIGLWRLGGFRILIETLGALNPMLIDPLSLGTGALIGFVGIGLGSPGQPHIVVRYMSIRNAASLPRASLWATLWNVAMGWGAVFIGLIGRAMLKDAAALPGGDQEMVFLVLASRLLGPVLYGLMIGGIFAAVLSTADSQLLVVSSTLVRDLWQKVFGRGGKMTEPSKVLLNRLTVVGTGLAAMVLALVAQDYVFYLVLFAWGGLGAAFGSTLIMSLYWGKTNRLGVVAGMITGTVVTIVWKQWLSASTGVYELIPAFSMSLLVILVCGWFFPERATEDDGGEVRRERGKIFKKGQRSL